MTVTGIPTTASRLSCKGQETGFSEVVRVGEEVVCTIEVRDDEKATTGVPSDFSRATTVGGIIGGLKSEIVSVGNGSKMTFLLNAPTTAGEEFVVVGRMVSNSVFAENHTMNVRGAPTDRSVLECKGEETGLVGVAHYDEMISCVINVRDDDSPTTGFATDFGAPEVNPSALNLSSLAASASGDQMSFRLKAPASGTLEIRGRMGDGSHFLSLDGTVRSLVFMQLLSHPTNRSSIDCEGTVSGTLNVRSEEAVVCTISPRNFEGVRVSSIASDFSSNQYTEGGTNISALTVDGGEVVGSSLSFTLDAPSNISDFFWVAAVLKDGTMTEKFQLHMIGTPANTSTLSCKGKTSDSVYVTAGEFVECNVVFRNADGELTTGLTSDFESPVLSGGFIRQTAATSESRHSMSFEISAPLSPQDVSVSLTLSNNGPALRGIFFHVLGVPTEHSTLDCVGEETAANTVRLGGVVVCTISAKDEDGSTTGFSDLFTEPETTGTYNSSYGIQKSNPDFFEKHVFKVTAPSIVGGGQLLITGRMKEGNTKFSEGAFVMYLIEFPDHTSELECESLRYPDSVHVRSGEHVGCFILAHTIG
jgi:hypothetical protein